MTKEDSGRTLGIRSVKHLVPILRFPLQEILSLADQCGRYYREFPYEAKGKTRLLVEATGRLKLAQRRILDGLLRRLPPFPNSFGAAKGRSIKDNAMVHVNSNFIVKLDIKDFYPSVHSSKVYRFFEQQECSPDVARILTALTTRNYALPLGTSTSPMLADQIIRPIDVRIRGMSDRVGLRYTRYVDDITLSGSFPLERVIGLVLKVLRQSGFKVKKEKLVYYDPDSEEKVITGVAIRAGGISAPVAYVDELEYQLRAAGYQSKHRTIEGSFYPREHYRGKIYYVRWLDAEVGNRLLRLYRRVKWRHLEWAKKQRQVQV